MARSGIVVKLDKRGKWRFHLEGVEQGKALANSTVGYAEAKDAEADAMAVLNGPLMIKHRSDLLESNTKALNELGRVEAICVKQRRQIASLPVWRAVAIGSQVVIAVMLIAWSV